VHKTLRCARECLDAAGGVEQVLQMWWRSFGVEPAWDAQGRVIWPCFPAQLLAFAERLSEAQRAAGLAAARV
jgi:hypothetical protein